MLFTYETLDETVGFPISNDSFFSEGTVLMLNGSAWTLAEVCGDQLVFRSSDALEYALDNMEFFSERAKEY